MSVMVNIISFEMRIYIYIYIRISKQNSVLYI